MAPYTVDGFYNLGIAAAATKVPCKRRTDLGFTRFRCLFQQSFGRHEHPRSTVTALQGAILYKSFLKRMQAVALHEAFHSVNMSPLQADDQDQTGVHRFTIQKHRASSAIADIATPFCTCKIHALSQKIQERCPRFYLGINRFAVYG
jgi:hypothetical protein